MSCKRWTVLVVLNMLEIKTYESLVLMKVNSEWLKVGDYVYLYDSEEDLILANLWDAAKLTSDTACCDGVFYPLGGGREPGETSISSLQREVREETNDLLHLKTDKIVPFLNFEKFSKKQFRFSSNTPFIGGKKFNVYCYLISHEKIGSFSNKEVDGSIWDYGWYSAEEVFSRNDTMNIKEWLKFCQKNSLKCFGIGQEQKVSQLSLEIAANLHKDQKDKGGNPYITHLVRVSKKLLTDTEKAVGLLHDTFEDTAIDRSYLVQQGIPKTVVDSVNVLTRRKSEEYFEYIRRIIESGNAVATKVKLADLEDNSSRPDQISKERLNKYREALRLISENI
jgi:hypothetical protein